MHVPLSAYLSGFWGREREREREFTPFQPHRADAGAARISPGRSHYTVLVFVYNNARETRIDITSKDRSNPGQQLLKLVKVGVKEQSIGIQNRIQ